jgi:hypothetical protein
VGKAVCEAEVGADCDRLRRNYHLDSGIWTNELYDDTNMVFFLLWSNVVSGFLMLELRCYHLRHDISPNRHHTALSPHPIVMASLPTTSVPPFLSQHSLLIATPSAIILHSHNTNETLLECATADGLVHARASRSNSALIAVASDHVVLLCDAASIRNRKCKLSTGNVGGMSILWKYTS